jgi:transcriptional regulator with XRE-family HTH domain
MENEKLTGGEIIRQKRLELQYSELDMAKEVGVQYCTYYCFENNSIIPTPLEIARIADVLELDENALIQLFIF